MTVKWREGLTIFVLFAASLDSSLLSASAQESSNALVRSGARIDMERLASDIATAIRNKSAAAVELPACAKSAAPGAFIPLFIPRELRSDLEQNCSPSKSANSVRSASPGQGSFLVLEDGYAATRNFDRYELAIRGTREVFATAGSKTTAAPDYWREFSENESGGEIAFGYAGAHYLATFECKVGGTVCLTAEEARQAVANLLLCALDGQCIEGGTQQINARRQ